MEGIALEIGIGAVKFMVESFMQQLSEQKHLIKDAKNQAEGLEADLKFLKEHLEGTAAGDINPKGDNLIARSLLREVRTSVYKAEDAIDSFVIEASQSASKWFPAAIPKPKLLEIADLIKSVAEKVKQVREKVEKQITTAHAAENHDGLGEYKTQPGKQEYAPIFMEEEKQVRERLTREAHQPEAIFITGMHGIGKTTVAAKVFYDPDMRMHFTKHIWLSVSNPTARNIFIVVLRQLKRLSVLNGPILQDDWELSQEVVTCLKGERLLIVLDNVSEMKNDDWKSLKSALKEGDKRSKVLVTTNNEELPRSFAGRDSQVKLETLNNDECWALLQWKVFGKDKCPSDLEKDGLLIAGNCHGHTQAIVFAADTLRRKDSPSYIISRRQKIWQQVSLGMIECFIEGMGPHSYNKLPYHLRTCFLYLGIFPKNSKFSVFKLIHMWIAEGFVRPSSGLTSEQTAEDYLSSLIDRNLVIVEEMKPDGSPKTCSLNASLYDFCRNEAGNDKENFLQEFIKNKDGDFNPPINEAVQKNRRVSVHSDVSNFFKRFISSRHHTFQIGLRSFVSHSKEPLITLHSGDVSKIRAAFKLLRVLDAKPMRFNKIHSDLCQLIHLRYVTLSLNGDVLPATISKLRNMQTLRVYTTSPTLDVKADILKMDELRHFKTNASSTLPKKSIKASDNKDERLQTLCGISPTSCTQDFFKKTPNLKKLGIVGRLSLLLQDENTGLLSKLANVEKLKLINYVAKPKHEGKLSNLLLQPSRFPESLRSLTLSATSLEWSHISFLGSLPKLEELKLKDNAFVGDKWVLHDEGFPHLQVLHIERLNFQQWKSESDHFPKLRCLTLSECRELREIPVEFADISTFQILHLRNGCHASAAECAQAIKVEKGQKMRTDSSIMFKLI